jgi:hypothetical protein
METMQKQRIRVMLQTTMDPKQKPDKNIVQHPLVLPVDWRYVQLQISVGDLLQSIGKVKEVELKQMQVLGAWQTADVYQQTVFFEGQQQLPKYGQLPPKPMQRQQMLNSIVVDSIAVRLIQLGKPIQLLNYEQNCEKYNV